MMSMIYEKFLALLNFEFDDLKNLTQINVTTII